MQTDSGARVVYAREGRKALTGGEAQVLMEKRSSQAWTGFLRAAFPDKEVCSAKVMPGGTTAELVRSLQQRYGKDLLMEGEGTLPQFDSLLLIIDHAFNDLYDSRKRP